MDVSVILLTYNHEPFIAQAIESVMGQRTDATFEILIPEDCSTDRTRDIVLTYAGRYPETIRPLLSDRNVGGVRAYLRAYEAATGEFVAYLDGDDYWLPDKLERQLRFMREHLDCPGCYHAVQAVRDDVVVHDHDLGYGYHEPWLPLEAMIEWNYIPSGSFLYRRSVVGQLPSWFERLPYSDWPVSMFVAEHGDIGYVDEVLGAYRVHSGGMWSAAQPRQMAEWQVRYFEQMRTHFDGHYRDAATLKLAKLRFELAKRCIELGDRRAAVTHTLRSFRDVRSHAELRASDRLKTLGPWVAPGPYDALRRLVRR